MTARIPLEQNGQFAIRRQGRMHRPFRAIRPQTRVDKGKILVNEVDL